MTIEYSLLGYHLRMDGLLGIINSDKPVDNGPLRPLAVRMRPKTLDEVLGQDEALADGSPLRTIAEKPKPSNTSVVAPASIILYGPPGVGKTTIAHIIAHQSGRRLVELSATSASVKDVKNEIEKAKSYYSSTGVETILFLDEIHRFSKSQQDSLLPAVENRDVTLIAATTENPSFSVIRPLLSRSIVIALKAIDDESMMKLLKNAVSSSYGLDSRVSVRKDAATEIVRLCTGDARSALTTLEAAAAIAMSRSTGDGDKKPVVTINDVRTVMEAGGKSYDRSGDDHYDMASAFIKSMRGSDPDAAIYWAARMLRYGEDPRFIARRVMIAAAEEVGLADPQVLQTAVAAAQAIDMVGMPEGRIPLAEAIIAVATAPKSNRAYLAMDRAIADVDNDVIGPVPIHLRNATSKDKKNAGYGADYKYAHDWPHGVAPQQYLPDGMDDVEYYSPTTRGHEKEISTRMDKVRAILHDPENELTGDERDKQVMDADARASEDHEHGLWIEGRKIIKPEPKQF